MGRGGGVSEETGGGAQAVMQWKLSSPTCCSPPAVQPVPNWPWIFTSPAGCGGVGVAAEDHFQM